MMEEERLAGRRRGCRAGVRAGRGPLGVAAGPSRGGQGVPGTALRHLPCSSRGICLELLACGFASEKKKKPPLPPSPLILIVFLPDVFKKS